MRWLGVGLLGWFVVSMVTAPHVGRFVRRRTATASELDAIHELTIDLRDSVARRRHVVLVVDDDIVSRILLSSALSKSGYNTIEATGGPVPIALPGDVCVDAVVVDHRSCTDRGQLLHRVRAQAREPAPIVVMVQSEDDPTAWLRTGADGFITKPFSPGDVVAAVDAQLRRGAAWRHVLDAQAEEHAAVTRVMVAATDLSKPTSTAAALCDALNESEIVDGTALVSFAPEGPTVLATAGEAPWDVRQGRVRGDLAEALVRVVAAGPCLAGSVATSEFTLPPNEAVTAAAPLGDTEHPLGLLATRLTRTRPGPSEAEPGHEGVGLAVTIHLARIATDLLRPELEERFGDTTGRRRLGRMMDERSFTPVFQPIVDLTDTREIGYEALTRFPAGAEPLSMFREAAALGLGVDFERATLELALDRAATIAPDRYVAFNVSPALLLEDDGLGMLLSTAERSIVVELSEHDAIDDYDAVRSSIDRLDPAVRLSVDDAGSGFASLRHILVLRPDFVKLDRSWVHGVRDDPARQALIAGVAHFVREIGAELIAEGVETPQDRDVLVDLGVEYGQGWLFGRPTPTGRADATPVG